jgi:RNA polymerase sigma factor (sigma-70 family)
LIERKPRFDTVALTHLDAAYNLARWLVRDEHVAQDMVQDAYLRALKYYDGFRGGDDIRPWLMRIVRNTCYTWLQSSKRDEDRIEFDEERDSGTYESVFDRADSNPEAVLLRKQEGERVNLAISALPPAFREVLVLRELEEFSYDEIAAVVSIPAGTVMSRLARARAMLRKELDRPMCEE